MTPRGGAGSRTGAAVLLAAAMAIGTAVSVSAAGSANLYPSGASGNRANTEWRTSSYGAGVVARRTLLHAYAVSGEYLLMGSSAVGQGAADILVWNPGLVTGPPGQETIPATASFSCDAQRTTTGLPTPQGEITSRAQELAGPDTVPAGGVSNGYMPCYYQAPSTGIYSVAMVGPAGMNANGDGTVDADVALTGADDFDAAQGTSVAAWDLTVRGSLTDPASTRTGRVFTYVLALFTAGNGRPVDSTTYAVTDDGYRYQLDDRGIDPNGWVQYANELGFLDPDGTTPLYHDAVAANSGSPGQLTSIEGGVEFAKPQYPIFFEPPADATLTALGIPLTAAAPGVSQVAFSGSDSGSTSYYETGGTFTFTSADAGVYQIVISRDGSNFDPTNTQNRVLRGMATPGVNTVTWNGTDNSGAYFPVGSDYAFQVQMHAGEYHFPFIDVENDVLGGPTLTLLNPPNGVCPALNGGCNGAFYDDRGYTTSTGATVGTPGSVLCGTDPPAVDASDPIAGFDSSGTQRAFGASSGGNTNVPCTGDFGDAKGLDLWTYYPSVAQHSVLSIVSSADIAVGETVNDPTPPVGSQVTFTVTATDNGPDDATGVALIDLLPSGLTYVSSSASQGAYDSSTGVWTVGNVANGGSATLTVTATVDRSGVITDTASKSAEDQPDPVVSNNSASSQVNGQAADIGVAVSASAPNPPVGGTVMLTVTATNHGPDDATGVVIADPVPPGLTCTATPAQGTYDPGTGDWDAGALNNGASTTLVLSCTVTQPGPITDTATRTQSTPPDLNAADDQASVTLNAPEANLAVTLTPPGSLTPGGSGDYDINVSNSGPAAAQGPISVTDTLPSGATLAAYSGSGWSCAQSGHTVTCTHAGPLASGASEPPLVLHVTAPNSPGAVLIDSVIVSSATADPDLVNNTAVTTTAITAPTPPTPVTGAASTFLLGALLFVPGLVLCETARRRLLSSRP